MMVAIPEIDGASGPLEDPRVSVHIVDGAEFVAQADPASYDVALVDSTDPIGPAQVLFRAPFFRGLQRALTPEGLLASQSLSPWVQAAARPMNLDWARSKWYCRGPLQTGTPSFIASDGWKRMPRSSQRRAPWPTSPLVRTKTSSSKPAR